MESNGIDQINVISINAVLDLMLEPSLVSRKVESVDGVITVTYIVGSRLKVTTRLIDSDYMLEVIRENTLKINEFVETKLWRGVESSEYLLGLRELPGDVTLSVYDPDTTLKITECILHHTFGRQIIKRYEYQYNTVVIHTDYGMFIIPYNKVFERTEHICNEIKKCI